MKRTDALTNFIAVLLFLAFAAYAGFSAARSLRSTTVTAVATAAEYALGGAAEGLVIRRELLLSAEGQYVELSAEEGKKVAAGAALGAAADEPAGLIRARRRKELLAEIARLSAVREYLAAPEGLAGRDAGAVNAARAAASAATRHDLAALESASAALDALLLGEDESVSESRLAALKAELESIDGSAVSGAERLIAPASGLFSAVVDGWEHIGPQALDGLTPTVLDALAAGSRPAEGRVYGKIVTGCDWYFAAAMREADAAGLTPGGAATLVLGRGYGEGVEARVLSVSEPEGGRRAVVFRCDKAMAETMALRRTVAEVRFDRYSGIRVPAGALREEDGESFVWTVTAMQLERKSVEPLYQGDGFAILRRGSDSGALREGDTVVVSGEDLYEGKVMNEF